MSLDILERGEYIIEFKNQQALVVRYSNSLFSKLFFEKEIPKSTIQVCIN